MLNLDLIDDEARLALLHDEWNELVADSDVDGLFLTHEWSFTWWRRLAEGRRLRVLAVRADGQLVALAPLAVRPPRLDRSPALACLELLGAGEAGSDYLDVIVRRGYQDAALAVLAPGLARERHLIALSRLRPDAWVANGVAAELVRRGWSVAERADERAPYIPLTGLSFDGYLDGLGAAHRYAFRRRLRSLEREHDVELELVTSEARRPLALRTLMDLHGARWLGRGVSEAFGRAPLVAFHDELSRLALARGWLRLYLLRVDGVPVAALYGFRYGGVFWYYQSGFHPAWATRSVGLVTLGLVIRAAIAEGLREFDLGHGEESYKGHWARAARSLRRIELYPPGVRGWLFRGATTIERRARRVGRQVVEVGRQVVAKEMRP
jgi:CelD/BcsL family acetyltransferase involved in cellulose biosynthesis